MICSLKIALIYVKFANLFAKFSENVPTKTNDISFLSTLEINNVKKVYQAT